MAKLFSIIMLSLILLSSGVQAVSMGTLLESDLQAVQSGESGKFTILVWNSGSEPFSVNITAAEHPSNWTAIISPNLFTLNSSSGSEYVKIPGSNRTVMATKVDVIVKLPASVAPGTYNLTVLAATVESSNSNIALSQERVFRLSVDVRNQTPYFNRASTSVSNQTAQSGQPLPALPGTNETGHADDTTYLYLAVILIIVLISLLLYKYS